MADGDGKFVYFSQLKLSNVRAYAEGSVLDLCIEGRPAAWTLILGENGLGKTTLLQCLALLRPIINVQQSQKTTAGKPDRVEPAIPGYADELLVDLARMGEDLEVELEATFTVGRQLRPSGSKKETRGRVTTSAKFSTTNNDLKKFDFSQVRRRGFIEPLVIGYSAARHAPYSPGEVVSDNEDPTASLFNPEIELVDAIQALENLDYLALRKDKRAKTLLHHVLNALATILPDVAGGSRIVIHGPPLPGRTHEPTGVSIGTYSGEVPLRSLSVGYQTMFAWTVDLALRMAEHHSDAAHPLREPAIVLIDELDLHLHPKWQRRVRQDLSKVFPNVQFIVTTHSPVLAQTYLDTNIAVLTREGDHARIDNEPNVVRSWRLDQVSESLLHDLEPYSPEITEAFRVRSELLAKTKLTARERAKLEAANALVATIPSEKDAEDQRAAKLIREAAQLLATRPS